MITEQKRQWVGIRLASGRVTADIYRGEDQFSNNVFVLDESSPFMAENREEAIKKAEQILK